MKVLDATLLILSSMLGLFLAIYILSKRRAPGSQALSVLILGASLWSLGYAFELVATTLRFKLFWEKFEYFGIVIIPVAWFTFVAQYLGNQGWMGKVSRQRFLLMVIPVITLGLVWTNAYHGLLWEVLEQPTGELVILNFKFGVWYWVLMSFSYLLLLIGSIRLALSLITVVRLQRGQIRLALLAILLPWAGHLLYISGLVPEFYLDRTAIGFLFSGVLFSISLFRFQLVDILPIAQETVFEGLADCVFVLDLNNRIVDMNPMARRQVKQLSEMLGKEISVGIPELLPYIQQAGNDKEFKGEIVRGEGADRHYYDLHISLLTSHSGVPIGRAVVLHEITELKRNQAELEEVVSQRTEELKQAFVNLQRELMQRNLAEKRFEVVVESAPDAMFLIDKNGKILLMNSMAEQLFGYPRAELIGVNLIDQLIPIQYRSRQRKVFAEFLEDASIRQTSFGVELYANRKDGTQFPIEVDLSRLDVAEGFWMAINVHDISERKRAEAALRESEQTYRALFENAGDAIFLSDLEGRIIQGNRKAAQMLGFSQRELRALSLFDVTSAKDHGDVRHQMEMALKGNQPTTYLRYYLKRSGEELPTENLKVVVKDADGKPKYFQNVARDISERIKAEHAQSALLDEIKKSNEQMRDLALRLQEVQELERQELAGELHDRVGQTLTGLNFNLKILQNQLPSDAMPEAQKRLQESLTMVEETTHKIRDVMADLHPPVLDEYGLMAAIKWYCSDFSDRTGIFTEVRGKKLEPGLGASIEKILYRLVQESLNNVAKHARATKVMINLRPDHDVYILTVKDNGVGFDTRNGKGPNSRPHWGLLSMRQRAASIGAELAIESGLGKGTQVTIRFRSN